MPISQLRKEAPTVKGLDQVTQLLSLRAETLPRRDSPSRQEAVEAGNATPEMRIQEAGEHRAAPQHLPPGK